MANPSDELPLKVREALQGGNLIEAIKLLRTSSGLGLKEAKDIIDGYMRGVPLPASRAATASPLPASVVEAMNRGEKIEAIKLLRDQSGMGLAEAKAAVEGIIVQTSARPATLSPGEIPRSGNFFGWVVVALAISVIAYFLFQK